MNSYSFMSSLNSDQPPSEASVYLQALWQDAKGNWNEAHKLIQDIETPDAAWIHAYLHRKEGDIANADYWYLRAGKKRPQVSINQEWDDITNAFL